MRAEQAGPGIPPPGLITRVAYGFGQVAEGAKTVGFDTFLLFYYNQVLGLPGSLAGAAILCALCVDAVTDPLVGSVSDGLRSRLGRRHPFMYGSALPMALCFVMLFNPPALGAAGTFAWLLVFAVGVRVSMTFYSVPSNAMLAELTMDYDGRTGIASLRTLFFWLGSLLVGQLGYLFFFAPSERFADGRFDASAYGDFGWTCGALILLAILVCSAGTHHRIGTLPRGTPAAWRGLRRLVGDFSGALGNRSYRMLATGALFASVAAGFTSAAGLYINTFYWGFSTQQISLLLFSLFAAVGIATVVARPISARFEKRRSALWLSVFATFIGPFAIGARLLGIMPENGDPLLLWLVLGHTLVLMTSVVTIQILVISMVADAVDITALRTGRRQEGVFFSVLTFIAKASSGIGGFIAGVMLDLIAFPRTVDPAAMDPAKAQQLGLATIPVLIVLYTLLCLFLSGYRISRAEHRRATAELARAP